MSSEQEKLSPEEKRIAAIYGDLSAVFLALFNALEAKGVISKADAVEFFQERLVQLQVDQRQPTSKYLLLWTIATQLLKTGK